MSPAFLVLISAGLAAASPAARPEATTQHQWWDSDSACRQSHLEPADEPARKRPAYDEETGRDLETYPPHRIVDFKHMRLEIHIDDMNRQSFYAGEDLTLQAISTPVSSLVLDCGPEASMVIKGIRVGADFATGHDAAFEHHGEQLTIQFDQPLDATKPTHLFIAYSVTDPPDGLHWAPESPSWPGRAAQLHSQGQAESNHYWFPCHDFPNERLTTELIVNVPNGYTVSSNGRLISDERSGDTETFHFSQDSDHVPYLVSLVVGKFDVVDIGSSRLPMPVYVPPGRGGDVQRSYGRTPDMIRLFEKFTNQPYPWAKYAQVLVWNFGAGGMENTSATTLYDTAILDKTAILDGDLDGLISHELAHQWFGDLLTCKSWEHTWLNEGFATYFSNLWFEERDGKDAYLAGVWGNFQGIIASDHADAPYQAPMCSKEYTNGWESFGRAANPYGKGSSILHMLRRKVGDDNFKKALALYVARFKHGSPETDDLRYAFEDVSGLSLQRFFNQWCFHPGVPHVDVDLNYDTSAGELEIALKQTQNIDGYNPAFFFTLPIYIVEPGERAGLWLSVDMDTKSLTKRFKVSGDPVIVSVDPDLTVLADLHINQPAVRFLTQLESGPTIAPRLRAIQALQRAGEGEQHNATPESITALTRIARDPRADAPLRNAAINALVKIGAHDTILELASHPPAEAKVRRTVYEHVPTVYKAIQVRGNDSPARLIDDLRHGAAGDQSYACRAAAIRALGQIKAAEAKPIIIQAANTESQHDQVRQAALDALASLDDADGLAIAIKYSGPGAYNRTRPSAIAAVAALAHHHPDDAFNALLAALDTHEGRASRAAESALVKLGEKRAIPALEQRAAAAVLPAEKQHLQASIKQLEEPKPGDSN